jgi:4-amino-4-deoxy-L-arabinose transferase-like glycosyltransferase
MCCRGRASHRLGFRGLLSFTKNVRMFAGWRSASAHSPHWRSDSVAGCCGSQGQGICAHSGAHADAKTNISALVAAVRMPHYTGDLSRSWLIVPLLFLYLFHLGAVGFLGPDEPRYASIGREMARSHDFVTPRLDGNPWFEKPPLLYWMTAAGHILRLPDEWAARLPVAILSAAFLAFFFKTIQREFSDRVAIVAATILATSVGWLAYSFVAVTDLPMSATFAAAMLIAIFDTRRERGYVAGALLGASILAKGLVPVVLIAPAFLIARGKRLTMLAGCVAVATPWYLLCWLRNGRPFLHEFVWKQHFERYLTPSLQHVQPFWYYLPILLAAVFPWTPLAPLLARGKTYTDVRMRFLAGWLIYALVFLSLSQNKLPGYVLPMLPALAIVLAVGLEKTGVHSKWWLGATALMLIALPAIAALLPAALISGIRKAPVELTPRWPFIGLVLTVAALVWFLAWREQTSLAILTTGLAVAVGVVYLKNTAFPILENQVSVRAFWRASPAPARAACLDSSVRREWQYGLNYYAAHPLAECSGSNIGPRIAVRDGQLSIESR